MTRVLRADTRSNVTYITRLILFIFLLFAIYGAYKDQGQLQAPGKSLFMGIVIVDFVIITLLAVGSFSTTITEEKELGTLALLRMTRVNPLSILLGKWGSRLFSVFLLLIAQCPFTILSIAFGGVSLPQIVAVHLSLSAYLVLTSSLGLLSSVICRRSAAAMLLTGSLLTMFFLIPWILSFFNFGQGLRYFLYQIAILFPSDMLQKKNYGNWQSALFSSHILFSYGISLGLLLISTLTFDFFNSERQGQPKPKERPEQSEASVATAARSRRVWSRPQLWFEFHYNAGGFLHWLTRVFFCLGFVILVFLSYDSIKEWRLFQWILGGKYIEKDGHFYYYNSVAWVLFQGFALLSLAHLAHGFGVSIQQELKEQTLSSLILFPEPLYKIFHRKLMGLALAHSPYLLGLFLSLLALWGEDSSLLPQVTGVRGFRLFSVAVFFIQFVAWLSLWIRWGPFFAALGFIFLSHTCYRMDSHILVMALALLCGVFTIVFRDDLNAESKRQSWAKESSDQSEILTWGRGTYLLGAILFFAYWSWSFGTGTYKFRSDRQFHSLSLALFILALSHLFLKLRLGRLTTVALLLSVGLILAQLLDKRIQSLLEFPAFEEISIILLCFLGHQLLKLHFYAQLDQRARQ